MSRTQPDDRLWVHFDLEMKKIVPWNDPNDLSFVGRLKRRIAYLAKPIIRQNQKDEVIERDRQEFASLSVSSRCDEIYKKFQLMLKAKRFWTARWWDMQKGWWHFPADPLLGIKKVNRTCQLSAVLAAESLTKKQIEEAVRFIRGSRLLDHDDLFVLHKEDIVPLELRRT